MVVIYLFGLLLTPFKFIFRFLKRIIGLVIIGCSIYAFCFFDKSFNTLMNLFTILLIVSTLVSIVSLHNLIIKGLEDIYLGALIFGIVSIILALCGVYNLLDKGYMFLINVLFYFGAHCCSLGSY